VIDIELVCLDEQLARGMMQQRLFDSKASIESYSEYLHDGFRTKYPELFKPFIGQAACSQV